MRSLMAVCMPVVLAAACAGGGPQSSTSSHMDARSTSTSAPPAAGRHVALARAFGDEVGLHARFPSAWYIQPYAATNLLITSFPVHVDDGRVWDAIPPGGTAIQIYDTPSGSVTACRRLAGAHARLRLGRYEPNYEGVGPGFRNEFHDGGHTVLVFTSFGGSPPTRAQRLLAERIVNSIRVDPGSCPVKVVVAVGPRARALIRLLARTTARHARRTAYAPHLSRTRGPAGATVTITGKIPATGESGRPARLARLVVWWNLDPRFPSPAVASLTNAGPGRLVKVATIPLTVRRSRYRSAFTVPEARPGRYPVVVLQEANDGSVAQLGSASYTVR